MSPSSESLQPSLSTSLPSLKPTGQLSSESGIPSPSSSRSLSMSLKQPSPSVSISMKTIFWFSMTQCSLNWQSSSTSRVPSSSSSKSMASHSWLPDSKTSSKLLGMLVLLVELLPHSVSSRSDQPSLSSSRSSDASRHPSPSWSLEAEAIQASSPNGQASSMSKTPSLSESVSNVSSQPSLS